MRHGPGSAQGTITNIAAQTLKIFDASAHSRIVLIFAGARLNYHIALALGGVKTPAVEAS